jgi:hypothetical protein
VALTFTRGTHEHCYLPSRALLYALLMQLCWREQASSGKSGLEVNTVIVAMVVSLGALSLLIVGLMHAKRRGWLFATEVAQDPSVAASDFSRMLEAPPPLPGRWVPNPSACVCVCVCICWHGPKMYCSEPER